MILYPAIDILDGEVVRLVEGDFAKKTVFAKDPFDLLERFHKAGARYLHLVDLSGAREPEARQVPLLREVLAGNALRVQVGGGIRSLAEVEALLEMGADRVVLGSLVVDSPNLGIEALRTFGPEHLTFALDVRIPEGEGAEPIVMTKAWQQSSGLSFAQAVMPFLEEGLSRVLCTDIAVDGRLSGPNRALYGALLRCFPGLEIQASGGIAALDDIRALKQIGVHSAVAGRSLLAGAFTLQEALTYAQ